MELLPVPFSNASRSDWLGDVFVVPSFELKLKKLVIKFVITKFTLRITSFQVVIVAVNRTILESEIG